MGKYNKLISKKEKKRDKHVRASMGVRERKEEKRKSKLEKKIKYKKTLFYLFMLFGSFWRER